MKNAKLFWSLRNEKCEALFISALLLSLLCGVFYNFWKYEVERIVLEEGGWQSRITGQFDPEEIEAVRNFASVKDAVVRDGAGDGAAFYGEQREGQAEETVIDLYFERYGAVLKDTPRIAELAGASPEQTAYHYGLLAMYLIRHPSDPAPRLLFQRFRRIFPCFRKCGDQNGRRVDGECASCHTG